MTDETNVPTTSASSGAPTLGGESAGMPAPSQGELLDLSESAAAKRAREFWQSTEDGMRYRRARWKANRARRGGMVGVRMWQPDPDRSEWQVRVPLGAPTVPQSLNKAARLCRRLRSTLMSDPPVPEVTPERDEPAARGAAEFLQKLLPVIGDRSGYNDAATISRAIDIASTYDSGFRHWIVDKARGGSEPLSILASPQATAVADATDRAVMVPAPVDPATGLPLGEPETVRIPWGDELVTRYVAADGVTLTNDPAAARVTWKPGIRCDVVNGNHIRMFPATVSGVADANMVQVGSMLQWSEIEALYPDVAKKYPREAIAKALQDRPDGSAALLPPHVKDTGAVEIGDAGDKRINPDRLGFVLCTYVLMSPAYPRGAFLCTLGDNLVLARTTWCDTTRGFARPLPIPVDQFKQFEEGNGDPYGVGAMTLLGSGNEVRASLLGGFLEHLDRFNRRKTFYPHVAMNSPQQLNSGTLGDYIPYNAAAGLPVTESIPPFPDAAVKMFENVTAELDDESGLQAVAQGENPKGVTSGFHAQQLIEQVQVGLSDVKQATADGISRGWLIVANLVRAFYRQANTTQFAGDDGSYREREWRGQDLDGFQDIRISKSSFTMTAPSAKMAVADFAAKSGLLTPQELKNIWRGNVGGLLGVQDDPHYLRMRRQLSQWSDGPTDPAGDPAQLQALGAEIFDALPADDLPAVAALRLDELGRCMASTAYARHPAPWRAVLESEYQRARAAAGVQTIAEQQQAAAAAQAAAMVLPGAPAAAPGAAPADAAPVMEPAAPALPSP